MTTHPAKLTVALLIAVAGASLWAGDKIVATPPAAATNPAQDVIALDLGSNVTMKLVLIPVGKFMMGSRPDEKKYYNDELPQREVEVSKPFYMGVCEVTQEQYERIAGVNPSKFKGAGKPVDSVSWDQAVEFCKKLSQLTGKTVTLPTEAQWEYACRAGTKTAYSFGDGEELLGDYACYSKSGVFGSVAVCGRKPNPWALYDMHGNVWEWCTDWYADTYAGLQKKDPTGPAKGEQRVLRGGSWSYWPPGCRSAYRNAGLPNYRGVDVGLRVCVEVE